MGALAGLFGARPKPTADLVLADGRPMTDGDVTRGKVEAFLGRDPSPTGAGRSILHIAAPAIPGMCFEWHPQARKVYAVRLGATPLTGEPVAFNIETHGDAVNAILIYARGYHEAERAHALKGGQK